MLPNTRTQLAAICIIFLALCVLLLAPLYAIRSILKRPLSLTHTFLIPITIATAISFFFIYIPLLVENAINNAHIPVSSVHQQNSDADPNSFATADLHCDALFWVARNLQKTTYHPFNKDIEIGTVDIPRLLRGKVNIQVFATVNSVPFGFNFEKSERPGLFSDLMFLKSSLELWPVRTWFSPKERVLYQAERLHRYASESQDTLSVVRSRKDLHSPSDVNRHVHGILAVEGLSSLDNQLSTVDKFFESGIRILGPVHFFDTEVGGSKSGATKAGLTPFGRDVMKKMREYGMIVDLAHSSNALISDILDLDDSERPAIILSHTGLSSVCSSLRNLDDDFLLRIGRVGGLVGIALFEPAICGKDLIISFVETIKHATSILGSVNSIALGSDWDGSVHTPVSSAETKILATALVEYGNFTHEEVKQIMHDNAYDFFMRTLPE